jgi:hypothetical protein
MEKNFEGILPLRLEPSPNQEGFSKQPYKIRTNKGIGDEQANKTASSDGSWNKADPSEADENSSKQKTATSDRPFNPKEEEKKYEILIDRIQEAERK